jgi:hypothetical protein
MAGLQAIGHFDATTNLHLAIGLPLRNEQALTNFLRELYDPASTNFQRYLSSDEFTERFGPTEGDYQKVIAFAEASGLAVTAMHPNRVVLDVVGPVVAIEKAFNITLRVYWHPTEPRNFHGPDVEPSVPNDVPILDVSGLDDFMPPRPVNLRKRADEQTVSFATGSGPGGDFIGYDFRAAYAPDVLLTGVGQVVGLFEFGPYFTNDIILYKQKAGLPDVTVTNVLLDGVSGIPPAGADDGEEALDIDMAICMAPGATIIVYEGNNALDIMNRIATDNKAKQIGCSFGFYPPPGTMDNVLLQYLAQGQTFFAASGDSGAYSTNLIFAPADDPNVTSVGGTSLTTSGPRGSWVSETTWGGSGGGITPHYAIPGYQTGMNMQTNHGSTTLRNFPDVAMLADVVIFWYLKNGQSGTVGGTSAAAPLWAGYMALVNQQAAANGKPAIGNLNSIIYGIGKTNPLYSTLFHDITTGNNFNTASPTNFAATAGYDLCTGWGAPNGSNFINFLAAPTDALQITPGTGFTITTPLTIPFGNTNVTLTLTNAGAASINWSLASTSAWLNVSATSGTLLPLDPASNITIALDPATPTNLAAGIYYAYVFITNMTSSVIQSRLFTFIVSAANYPVTFSGFNASVVVPTNGTPAVPQATGFDIPNNYCFYQAGLNSNAPVAAGSGLLGLPADGKFFSGADGMTVFQLAPYGANDVFLMGDGFPTSGTLTFASPQSYNSLAILASSANGGGLGSLVLHFTNGTSSASMNFNAQDWFTSSANSAIQGFGRLKLGTNPFSTENNGSNPNLYQTVISLAALGLNQPISSITFTKPAASSTTTTAIFGVSGSQMPPQVIIAQQPASITNNNPSASSTISVVAMGAPPLAYQWFSGTPATGTPLAGATSANLVFNPPVTTNQAGNYFVVISNSLNAVTSSVATLTVLSAPTIVQQPNPTNMFLFVGETARFSVTAGGAVPLSYYWQLNGAPISGANSSSYTIANVQLNNSGNYSVLVSNAFGTVTSSIVALSVFSSPAYPYGQIVLADHPIGYWRLDETGGTVAHDYLGTNNGTYTNVLLNQTGDNLIDTHKSARFGQLSSANSFVGNIPIDFATAGNATFTVEAWVNGGAQSTDCGLITKGTGGGGEQFNLDCGSASHAFRFFVRDASGGVHLANGTLGPNSTWRHLVGVCDEANGRVVLYINGISNASGTITAGSGLLSSANSVTLGSRQSAAAAYDAQFVGSMEEVAIYNYALTPVRILAHFNAVTNRPPVFLANPFSEPSVNAGQAYSANISTNATDPNGDAVTFAKLAGPTWLSIAGNGALSGTPTDADAGTDTFTVRASDPSGLFNTATMNISVIPAPPIIAAVSLQDTNLVLTWSGGLGPFQVQMAADLSAPVWQNVGSLLATNTLSLSLSNDAAFYRIIGQ